MAETGGGQAADRTIGAINGKWAILFKASLAMVVFILPLGLTWAVWVTSQIFTAQAFIAAGDRFTTVDGLQLEKRLIDRISKLPPDDWRDRILAMEGRQATIGEAQARILTILDRIDRRTIDP